MNDVQASASVQETVQEYYGRVLKSSADLKTSACCLPGATPPAIAAVLADIHPEVKDRFYGCGSPIPADVEGLTVLDLGCGSGRDCYVLSKLVGPMGFVIGIDMTEEQLDVARRHTAWHAERFGHAESNIEFAQGYIEDLAAVGLRDDSIDLVVSNCVLNLSPDKARVFREIFRVLKPGGELYFSDVFADRRVPADLATDPVLLGECLGGALYTEDFRRLLAESGCRDARIVEKTPLTLDHPEIEGKVGHIRFSSMTIRAFKADLEDRCEDYGHVAWYLGSLPGHPHRFVLDESHAFETQRPVLVCGNTAEMLLRTRYAPHFRIQGDRRQHHGLFDGAPATAAVTTAPGLVGCC